MILSTRFHKITLFPPRLALLGLDCVVIHREEKGFHPHHRRAGRGRVTLSLVCGLVAALTSSLVLVTITAGLAVKLTSH